MQAATEAAQLLTGTASVSPASSNAFIQGTIEADHSDHMAFNESGRVARGPSKSGPDLNS